MRSCASIFGWLLLLFAARHVAFASDEKKEAPENPKEQTVVDYDSKTHGALQVMGMRKNPVDWFDVLKDGKRAFSGNPKLLNNMYKLEPGDYVAVVNRTQRKVTIQAGKKTILLTGELVVEGKPDTAFWYPMQGKDRKVAGNPRLLNRPLPLFAGKYTVIADLGVVQGAKNLGIAEVKPGKQTVLKR